MNTPETKNPHEYTPEKQNRELLPYNDFLSEHPNVAQLVEDVTALRQERQRQEKAHLDYFEMPKLSDIPGHLGTGHEKAAFLVDEKYVVKSQNLNVYPFTPHEQQIDILLEGKGVPGLEQIITADPESGVIVTELAKGRSLPTIPSIELIGKIRKKHIEKLKNTLEWLKENRLEYDNAYNVLFDPKEGFTIIDYRRPIGVSRDKDPATRLESDANHAYSHFSEDHDINTFLNAVLSEKSKKSPSMYDTHGELERYTKPTIGRMAVKLLVSKVR